MKVAVGDPDVDEDPGGEVDEALIPAAEVLDVPSGVTKLLDDGTEEVE